MNNSAEMYKQFCELDQPAIMFHGAADTVTGSMHLIRAHDKIISLDCGLFQGRREEAKERNRNFPIPPENIDALLLSHAHIDHSGNIPHLVKKGFKGPIYATGATCDLCEIMLADSGHIHEEDANFWNTKRAKTPADYIEPLYTVEDAVVSLKQFKPTPLQQKFYPVEGVAVTYYNAGHILGSAYLLIEIENADGEPKRILFTGDMGRFDMPILRDPHDPLPEAEVLITESTYAGRWHQNPTDMKDKLAEVVNSTEKAGGKVIIPSFSVGRTQNVVYYLVQAIKEGLIKKLPIYVDSPLSTKATEIFRKHTDCYDKEATQFFLSNGDPFGGDGGLVRYITDVKESKALNSSDEPCVILSASGMCECGRILHHIKNNVTDRKNTICIVGFMAANTLGRRIVDGATEIRIFGREYPVEARVVNLHGFSAHADQTVFERLYPPLCGKLKAAFPIHGEPGSLAAMKSYLRRTCCKNVIVPAPNQMIKL